MSPTPTIFELNPPKPKWYIRERQPGNLNLIRKLILTNWFLEEAPNEWVSASDIHNEFSPPKDTHGRIVDTTPTTRFTLRQLVQEGYLKRRGITKGTEYYLIKTYPDPNAEIQKTDTLVYNTLSPNTWKTSAQLSKELNLPTKTILKSLRILKYDKRVQWQRRFPRPTPSSPRTQITEYRQLKW